MLTHVPCPVPQMKIFLLHESYKAIILQNCPLKLRPQERSQNVLTFSPEKHQNHQALLASALVRPGASNVHVSKEQRWRFAVTKRSLHEKS